MEKRFIPRSIEEITPDWLTSALKKTGILKDNSVSSIEVETIGEQGYMGILARLYLDYETPGDMLPASIIAKMPTKEAKNKITGEIFLNYERENRLYETLLDKLPVRTPKCYFADMDAGVSERTVNFAYFVYEKMPKGFINLFLIIFGLFTLISKRRYILLIEDLKDLDYIDQRDGCSFEDAKQVIKYLGAMQAAFWENPAVNQYWLKAHSEISRLMGLLYEKGLPVIERNFGDRLSAKEKEVFKWLQDHNQQIDDYILSRPKTLVHSDFRIDNVFFDRIKNKTVLIDWQTCYRGLGIADLAYFCAGSGINPFTSDQVQELIEIYHQALIEGGVTNYSLEECQNDYKYGFFVALRYILIILGTLEIDKDPDVKKLVELWLMRMKPSIENFDLSIMFAEAK